MCSPRARLVLRVNRGIEMDLEGTQMALIVCRSRTTRRHRSVRAGWLVTIGFVWSLVSFAQGPTENDNRTAPNPKPTPNTAPVTADERLELLKLIKSLQDRLDKLEAAQATSAKTAGDPASNATASNLPTTSPISVPPDTTTTPEISVPPDSASSTNQDDDDQKFYGRY